MEILLKELDVDFLTHISHQAEVTALYLTVMITAGEGEWSLSLSLSGSLTRRSE